MMHPTKVAIYKKTVLAATGDTIYQWRDPKENIPISFKNADCKLKLHGGIITCLKTFKGRVLVGTEHGHLIIFSLSPFGGNQKTYKFSSNSITSIRLFQGIRITATICFNKDTFIKGTLSGNELKYKIIRRDHLVQDARIIETHESKKLCTVGLKEGRLYKQHGKMSLIFHDNKKDPAQTELLDISEQGLILMKGYGGYIFLRSTNDKRMIDWIANANGGGIGVLILSQASHFVLYAGNEHPAFEISSIEPGKDGLYDRFGWQGEKYKAFFSSMDYHGDRVVLGGRRSMIVFDLKTVVQSIKFYQGLEEQEKIEADMDPRMEMPDDNASNSTRETLDDEASDVSEEFASESDEDQGETPDPEASASTSDGDQRVTPDSGQSTSEFDEED